MECRFVARNDLGTTRSSMTFDPSRRRDEAQGRRATHDPRSFTTQCQPHGTQTMSTMRPMPRLSGALTEFALRIMISLRSFSSPYRFGFMPRPHEPSPLDPAVLRDIVRKHLPAWFRACAASAEIIVMHEESFGTSAGEILLLGCALKYAGISGKTVHVTSGKKKTATSRSKSKPIAIETIYREERSSSLARDARTFLGRRRRSA
jgi:hypothetical protein